MKQNMKLLWHGIREEMVINMINEYTEYQECNECKDITTDIEQFTGCEGIWYNKQDDQYHLVMNQDKNRFSRVEINNCPWCGRKLK